MDLRRLLNVAYTVLTDSVPVEARAELDRRLRGEDLEVVAPGVTRTIQHDPERAREDVAGANREAMAKLVGMMPGAVRA